MKKIVVCVAVVVLVAFATPAFAVVNPFMDVPMNHWAYDAIGQLAAKGVLSGYPDGTYKGKQPTTRYEMASALARMLAYVDMTKASKQDVEMLKKLVVEFKDELDALGVKVDELDRRVAVLEDRLGGWKISGQLRLDIANVDNGDINRGFSDIARARLFLDRYFGEDESIHFHTRIEGTDSPIYGQNGSSARQLQFTRFYADFPVAWDMKMTVGRFLWDMEAEYYLDGTTDFSSFMGMGNDSWLTDRGTDGIGLQKELGLGSISFYMAHPEVDLLGIDKMGVWEFFAMGQLQFSENLGFDIGGQFFAGDDTAEVDYSPAGSGIDRVKLDSLWTVFGGLRFGFGDNIALKGIYYYQDKDAEYRDALTGKWHDFFDDSDASAWRAIIEIRQELLSFTSLWLEYDSLEAGFVMPTGIGALYHDGDFGTYSNGDGLATPSDVDIMRIAARQRWNDRWSTFLFFANYDVDVVDASFNQWGLGVAWQFNPSVGFGLSYNRFTYDDEFGMDDSSLVRFRTHITF